MVFSCSKAQQRYYYDLNLETSLGRKVYIFLTIMLPMIPMAILAVKLSFDLSSNIAYDLKVNRFVNDVTPLFLYSPPHQFWRIQSSHCYVRSNFITQTINNCAHNLNLFISDSVWFT